MSRRARWAGAALCLAATAASASAAPAAVDLVFYAPFFAKLQNGSTLTYSYSRVAKDSKLTPSFEDKVEVHVGPQGAENSLAIDMFSGSRARSLPNMSRTGASLVPAILEQDVTDISKFAGGSPYYLRNRFMEDIKAQGSEPTKIEYGGKTLDAWKVTLKPFAKDGHRDKLGDFAESTYELTFSEEVPGGLYALKSVAQRKDGSGPLLTEELTLQQADAAPAAGEPGKP
ncbi:MAG: hypothetical protein ABW275_08005 [Hansschlegelia sp.]